MHPKLRLGASAACALLVLAAAGQAAAAAPSRPWMDPKLSPDKRATLVQQSMSLEEQVAMLHGVMPLFLKPLPPGAPVPG